MAAAGKVRYTAFLSRLKPWLTAAVVAAALMPLALLFVHTAPAQGLTLAEVARALENAPHVYIATFFGPTDRLVREAWISRREDLCLTTDGQEQVLYDLKAKKKYRNLWQGESAEVADLSESEYAKARQIVATGLGFSLRDVPAGATWTRGPDGASAAGDLYELALAGESLLGESYFRRWVITVDPATRLPKEVQLFERKSAEQEWDRKSKTEFAYLTDDEMAAVMDR
jgi:hypothetical protein